VTRGHAALAATLLAASGCAAVTHPARMEPGVRAEVAVAYDRQRLDKPDPEGGPDELDHAARAQLVFGFGRHRAGELTRYAGVILGAQTTSRYEVKVPAYLAIDLYYQLERQEDSLVDVGVGALLGYYSGVYGLVGRSFGDLRLDLGLRATGGVDFDGVDVTPHALVGTRWGDFRVSAYAEFAAYRRMGPGVVHILGDSAIDQETRFAGDFARTRSSRPTAGWARASCTSSATARSTRRRASPATSRPAS
jgi:hypothetical protein